MENIEGKPPAHQHRHHHNTEKKHLSRDKDEVETNYRGKDNGVEPQQEKKEHHRHHRKHHDQHMSEEGRDERMHTNDVEQHHGRTPEKDSSILKAVAMLGELTIK